ncbi:hypothetical protein LJB85_03405, partial [Porphyromonadaceae bacterium OttesenSCG-928-L07]|nr:hypothetical protein [Porphyromonadaceae bacterium OttesenSCG-928-L07]
ARKKIQQYLYEEALNKKKKRRRAFILFALPGNGYFIDNLFKKNLSGYTIPGHGDISFISDVLQQSLGNSATQSTLFTQAATSAGIWGSKLSYIAVCGTTAVVTTSVCWMTFGEAGSDTVSRATETPTLVVTDSAEAERKDESVYHFIDSLPEQVITEEKLQEESSGELEKVPAIERAEAEKVVIKKQRIEHKKLVIRDTVIIKE